jgi:hypothetical protein
MPRLRLSVTSDPGVLAKIRLFRYHVSPWLQFLSRRQDAMPAVQAPPAVPFYNMSQSLGGTGFPAGADVGLCLLL